MQLPDFILLLETVSVINLAGNLLSGPLHDMPVPYYYDYINIGENYLTGPLTQQWADNVVVSIFIIEMY